MAESDRELQLKEKEREEKRKAKEDRKVLRQKKETAQTAKKWKGKDWFVIFSPSIFGNRVVGETPATNPSTLTHRNIEVSLSDLLGQPGKDFYRVRLGVDHIEGKSIHTRFNGYSVLKEHVMRMVRKRTQKIETVMYVETKDKWRLQVTAISILNRNTEDSVKKSVRVHMEDSIRKLAAKSTIDDFVRSVVNTSMQRGIKKSGTKIYPIRFSEIAKIEVKARPEAKRA